MNWYYAHNGERKGPVTPAEFQALVASGTVNDNTLVWRDGMANWQPYADVKGQTDASSTDTAVCAVSGQTYPKSEMIQFDGQWVSAEHRDTFFQRLKQGAAQPNELVYVGFWWRFLAKLIDGAITFTVGSIFNAVVLGIGIFTQPQFEPGDTAAVMHFLMLNLVAMAFGLTFGLAFHWFFLAKFQATPGKLALGFRVVRANGAPLSTGRIIGRYFAEMLSGLILYIGYMMAGFDKEQHRALHDTICDTRVIRKK